MDMNKVRKTIAIMITALLTITAAACSQDAAGSETENAAETVGSESVADAATDASSYLSKDDITVKETYENDTDGEHAIEVSGEEAEYSNIGVTKTGEADGDEADFYGENSAVFATEKGTLTIKDSLIETNGTHANAIFSYGDGTTVNVSDSVIETEGNCSGGLMTTGGGTMNAENLTINTSGNSSAAIRSDRGGGDVNVSRGYYKTTGTGGSKPDGEPPQKPDDN